MTKQSSEPADSRQRPSVMVRPGTILVVDDIKENRELFELRLEMEGHRVVLADGGIAALETLANQPIDLVLLDVLMPEINGFEVLSRIKTSEELRHIPVIMITAYDTTESAIECISAGAEDYLPRSSDPVLLRARINASLEKKQWGDRQREHIDRVVAAMTKVEQGDTDTRLDVSGDDVYAQLYRGFNLMTAGLQDAEHIITVAQDLSSELNLDLLLQRIIATTTELLDADRSTLFVHDPKTDELWSRVAEGIEVREIRFPSNVGLAGRTFTSGETQNISDPYNHPDFNPEFDTRTGYRTESILCMPIANKAGRRIGVTQVLNKRTGEFTTKDASRLHAFTSQIAVSFDDVVNIKNYNESILKSTTNGLVTLDEEQNIVTVNEAACAILREARDALIGAPAARLFAEKNSWILDSIVRVEETGVEDIAVDTDLVLPGGDKISMNLAVVPLIDVEGENIGAMLIIEDITSEMRVKATMSRYMSKEVADQLLAQGEAGLSGVSQKVSILFSDIRHFTTISETLGAVGTVNLLNEYFEEMVDVIFNQGGILDKYIGDAIMALFGAPLSSEDDADKAVAVACEMIVSLRKLNEARSRKNLEPIEIGIGVSTGDVVAGSVGSEKRMEYTVIGDSVNLAARLESANKFYGTNVLISEHTVRDLTRETPLREIDLIRVKGQDQPIAVYEALSHQSPENLSRVLSAVEIYAGALALYRARDWNGAQRAFDAVLEACPGDGPSRIHIERCAEYRKTPPADTWDGVWTMSEK